MSIRGKVSDHKEWIIYCIAVFICVTHLYLRLQVCFWKGLVLDPASELACGLAASLVRLFYKQLSAAHMAGRLAAALAPLMAADALLTLLAAQLALAFRPRYEIILS